MEWLSISNGPRQKNYELRGNTETLLFLAHHPSSGTIRISSENEKRVFLVGREGFRRNRTVLRNEYGIRIGQLSRDGSQSNQGSIEISGEQFNCVFHNKPSFEVTIYKESDVLNVCTFPEVSKEHPNSEQDLLTLILCWYLAEVVTKQEEAFA